MKTKTNVTTVSGVRMSLTTNDSLTLAFPGMRESTPATLRAVVCEKSLKRIAATTICPYELRKVEKALGMKTQLKRKS